MPASHLTAFLCMHIGYLSRLEYLSVYGLSTCYLWELMERKSYLGSV